MFHLPSKSNAIYSMLLYLLSRVINREKNALPLALNHVHHTDNKNTVQVVHDAMYKVHGTVYKKCTLDKRCKLYTECTRNVL